MKKTPVSTVLKNVVPKPAVVKPTTTNYKVGSNAPGKVVIKPTTPKATVAPNGNIPFEGIKQAVMPEKGYGIGYGTAQPGGKAHTFTDRNAEIDRTMQVIKNREAQGMDTSSQFSHYKNLTGRDYGVSATPVAPVTPTAPSTTPTTVTPQPNNPLLNNPSTRVGATAQELRNATLTRQDFLSTNPDGSRMNQEQFTDKYYPNQMKSSGGSGAQNDAYLYNWNHYNNVTHNPNMIGREDTELVQPTSPTGMYEGAWTPQPNAQSAQPTQPSFDNSGNDTRMLALEKMLQDLMNKSAYNDSQKGTPQASLPINTGTPSKASGYGDAISKYISNMWGSNMNNPELQNVVKLWGEK
jgi:hypothetical protein